VQSATTGVRFEIEELECEGCGGAGIALAGKPHSTEFHLRFATFVD
jgi:hypothetical protein